MLARYHRWVLETGATESVAALRKWVIQEAEFQTIAAESMHGLTGTTSNQQPMNHCIETEILEHSLENHKTAVVQRRYPVKFVEDDMQSGNAGNLLRRAPRLQSGRSYVFEP